MAAPFCHSCLGVRADGVPNTADRDSDTSVRIARGILEALGLLENPSPAKDCGPVLERQVERYLAMELPVIDASRQWDVAGKDEKGRRRRISHFRQYSHLGRMQKLVKKDATGTLEVEIGGDYLIAPDVTVGLPLPDGGLPFLHAAVSCKWTIRSDRVQNVRHEAVILTRHRRGRQPHIMVVTAEPLPTRLASIAKGTGEVDAVYHIALGELAQATEEYGSQKQRNALRLLTEQERLLDIDRLAVTLVL